MDSVLQTIAATLADRAFAAHPGVEIGAPVLEGERTYLDATGRPLFFTVTLLPRGSPPLCGLAKGLAVRGTTGSPVRAPLPAQEFAVSLT